MPKMPTDEMWYEIRDGQYFCKACNRSLVGVMMKEAFVLDAPTEGVQYHCEGCHKAIIVLSPC
jgi:hypothetical protein